MKNLTRQEYKEKILKKFNRKESVAISAPIYTGKTYLFNEIYEEVRSQKETIYLNLNNVFNLNDFYLFFKREIKRLFDFTFDDIFDEDLKQIEHIFQLFGKKAEAENKEIYIFFDNFQNVEYFQSPRFLEFNKIFNNSFINFQNLIFCFCIDNQFGINMFKSPKSELYEFCEVIDLLDLSERETVTYIMNFCKNNYINIEEESIFFMMSSTRNMIYYIEKICKELKVMNKNSVDNADIKNAINRMYDEFLIQIFDLKLTDVRGKKHMSNVLYAITLDKNPYDVMSKHTGSNNRGNVSKMITQLEKLNLIYKIKKPRLQFKVFDPFLKRYILENFIKDIK